MLVCGLAERTIHVTLQSTKIVNLTVQWGVVSFKKRCRHIGMLVGDDKYGVWCLFDLLPSGFFWRDLSFYNSLFTSTRITSLSTETHRKVYYCWEYSGNDRVFIIQHRPVTIIFPKSLLVKFSIPFQKISCHEVSVVLIVSCLINIASYIVYFGQIKVEIAIVAAKNAC